MKGTERSNKMMEVPDQYSFLDTHEILAVDSSSKVLLHILILGLS